MDAKKSCQETLSVTNQIEEVILLNNQIFTEKWEATQDRINCWLEEHWLLKTRMVELKDISGLQQTTLQHCQDTIAWLEETIAQLVVSVKKLEKTVCHCHDQLLSPGPHYTLGEEEEIVKDSEEEEEDGLEYETEDTSKGSYTTPPSTGGRSEPSPALSRSPTLEDPNPETNTILHTKELEAHIEVFLEEVEEDLEMSDLPPLENITPVLVPALSLPGFVPFAMGTSQHCIPPKSLLWKVYHPYQDPVGQCHCEPGGWCHKLPYSGQI